MKITDDILVLDICSLSVGNMHMDSIGMHSNYWKELKCIFFLIYLGGSYITTKQLVSHVFHYQTTRMSL